MDLLTLLLLPVLVLLIPTAYAGYIGAPYAPTFMAVVKKAFDHLDISDDDVLVDLGAGDGRIMLEASHRGAKTLGYELSPVMWFIAWIRLWKQPKATIKWRNFYKQRLPVDTTLIFIFLMPKHMGEVAEFLAKQSLGQVRYIMAYAFPFPEEVTPLTIVREPKCAPVYVYQWAEVAQFIQKQ
jgi:hypothetical protein